MSENEQTKKRMTEYPLMDGYGIVDSVFDTGFMAAGNMIRC